MNKYSNFKILIVDDNHDNLYTLRQLIEKHMDARVLEADSGKRAIEIALENPDIDLIVLDIQMPEMDGYEATREIRRRPEYADLPIIAMTANALQGDREACLAAGMDDYISKPVQQALLQQAVQKWTADQEQN